MQNDKMLPNHDIIFKHSLVTLYRYNIRRILRLSYLLSPNTKCMKFALQNLKGVALLKRHASYKNKQNLTLARLTKPDTLGPPVTRY